MYESNQRAANAPNQNYSTYKQSSLPMNMFQGRRRTDPDYAGTAAAMPVNAGAKSKPRKLEPWMIFAIAVVLVDIIAFFF